MFPTLWLLLVLQLGEVPQQQQVWVHCSHHPDPVNQTHHHRHSRHSRHLLWLQELTLGEPVSQGLSKVPPLHWQPSHSPHHHHHHHHSLLPCPP